MELGFAWEKYSDKEATNKAHANVPVIYNADLHSSNASDDR